MVATVTAAWLSRLFHPFVISPLVLFGAQASAGASLFSAATWTALAFALVIVPVLVYVLLGVYRGRYQDVDVSLRLDRHNLYRFAAFCFVLSTILLAAVGAPYLVLLTLASALVAVSIGSLFNRFVAKVSLHILTLAGCVAVLLFVAPFGALALACTGIPLSWARVYLGRHSLAEVFWGWAIGAGGVALMFLFLYRV